MKSIWWIGICIVLCGCQTSLTNTPSCVTQCCDIPVHRTSAIAWSCEEEGYLFGGRDEKGQIHHDLWKYNPLQDSWTALGNTPLVSRVNGCACCIGDKVYMGLGFRNAIYQDSSYLRDWWEYTPAKNTWRQLSDFPNQNTVGAIPYVDDNKIYCVHGFGVGFTADIIYFDIETESWTTIERTNCQDKAAMAGAGTSLHGRHFYGTGYNTRSLESWYEIQWEREWITKADVPSKREMATCASSDQYIYLIGGRHFGGSLTDGKLYDDILRYDMDTDQWTLAGTTNETGENRFAFTIDGIAFVGGGENDDTGVLNTFYRIED